MPVIRQPFVGETTSCPSVLDPSVIFNIKRVGSKDVMNHRNANSSVRYIQRDEQGDLISERDYPIGSMHVDTVALCLDSWNIHDPNDKPVKIDKDSILAYLSPEEIDDLYEKCLEVNPILNPSGGKEKTKNA